MGSKGSFKGSIQAGDLGFRVYLEVHGLVGSKFKGSFQAGDLGFRIYLEVYG